MEQTIGVTGPEGRLGSELVRQGCVPVSIDITDATKVRKYFENNNLDVLINTAAYTNVDGAELNLEEAISVNGHAVGLLRKAFKGYLVHLSTDYIFDGKSGPYLETDTPNPISAYGFSKWVGELELNSTMNSKYNLIVRTTILFDEYSDNFVTTVIKKLLNNETIHLSDELVGTPTFVPHLAESILMAIQLGITDVLNIAGKQGVSRYFLGQFIAEALRRNGAESVDPNNVQKLEGPLPGEARRPMQAGLKTHTARRLGVPIKNFFTGVDHVCRVFVEEMAGR